MFTNTLRRLASKIVMATMLFTVLSPMASIPTIAAPSDGQITVGFDNADGGYTITNGISQVVASGDSNQCQYQSNGVNAGYFVCQETLPSDAYIVTFNALNGYNTPANAFINLQEQGDETVLGNYTVQSQQNNKAVLGVEINNADGGYVITSGNVPYADVDVTGCGLVQPNGYFLCSQSLPLGAYTLTYKDVPGYITPSVSHVNLDANKTIRVDYTVPGPIMGSLTVNINNADGGYTVYDASNSQEKAHVEDADDCSTLQPNGYFVCNEQLPIGGYYVTFEAVPGYNAPATAWVDLNEEPHKLIYGIYSTESAEQGIITVAVNIPNGGFTLDNIALNLEVANADPVSDCGAPVVGYYRCGGLYLTGGYVASFTDVSGYITPGNIYVDLNKNEDKTVYADYLLEGTTGTVQVVFQNQDGQPLTLLNEWELFECTDANPMNCNPLAIGDGGAGATFSNLPYAFYRIVFIGNLPNGYTGRTVTPTIFQELDAQNNSLVFTITYTEEPVGAVAYVNVLTIPVPAHVRMTKTAPTPQTVQNASTSDTNPVPYDLAPTDRFTLPTGPSGFTDPTDYYIECLPAPGGYHVPTNPFIQKTGAVYATGSETFAGTCPYINVNPSEKVTITIDTIGIDAAAIYVDNVQVRSTTDDSEVPVVITTTENHTITFEDKDPGNFTVPPAIAIPAGTLNSSMTGTDLVDYLGYYVAHGSLAVAEVNTQNQDGLVYITIANDTTKWLVGHANTTPTTPLIVHFDKNISHEFHFQDRNTDYYLRAVPVTDPTTPGFSVSQDIQYTPNTMDVTHFQENYNYFGPQTLTNNVQLVGDYIAQADASFFRARTTNGTPIIGDIYLDINGEPTETITTVDQVLDPGQWTRIFISDVINDNDTTSYKSPITVGVSYTASPLNYNLSDGSFPPILPAHTVYDLESIYVEGGGADLRIELISTNLSIPPTVGLTVTLDPGTGQIDQQTVDIGGNIETTFINVDPNVEHYVACPDIPGLLTPNDLHIPIGQLIPGVNNLACIYTTPSTTAEILIETEAWDNVNFSVPITLRIDGTDYLIGYTDDTVPNTPATLSYPIDTAVSNEIFFGAMTGYNTPPSQVVNVAAGTSWVNDSNNIFNGLYTDPNATGADLIFHLFEADQNGGVVPGADVTVNTTTKQSDGSGDASFTGVDVTQAIAISFGNHPSQPGIYTTPLPINFLANQLVSGQVYEFDIYYVHNSWALTLDITTVDEPTELINVNGAVSLSVNGGAYTLYGYGPTQIVVSNDTANYAYQIDWGPALVSGYIEPLVDPLTVDLTGVNAGEVYGVVGLYRECVSGNCEVVTITAYDENNAILNSASISVNNVVVGTGQHTGLYDVGDVLNIEFENLLAYDTPEIFVNNASIGNFHTVVPPYTVLASPDINLIDAFYALDGSSVGFNVGTQDNQNTPLTENITHGQNGNEFGPIATPTFFAAAQTDLANYEINFADKPGYITPGSVTVSNQIISTIPANVTITPYTAGTTLVLGTTYNIVGTYIPHFMIEKSVTETTIVNNNKRVDYTIVITRHPDTAPGAMSIDLHDIISDTGRVLTGTNGGSMSVVSQNGSYSDCTNNCGDITAGTVAVPIDFPGNQVTITYQTLSNNSSIPANQSSNFTNTLAGSYLDGGQPVQVTTDVTVNVLAPPVVPGPGPGPSGGGGGGGGGTIMIRGDMILEITKLVSLNNLNFVDASDEDNPLAISERVDSTIFTKVNVKNLGQVSATNIKFSEDFDEGDSKITSDEIQNVQGDDGVEYNDVTGVIKIDKLTVGEDINFTYEQIVHENGSQGELAEEYLVLEGFSTRLTQNQDGLTKHGIGDHYPSWLIAGDSTVVSDGDLLQLSIRTDKAAARVGEEVTYTITARNNADFDFSGLIITWNYSENALEVLNPFGGRDNGTEIHWDRGILRPGESVQYQVRARVSDVAPVGGNVRTTARGLVNEIENPAVVDHYLTIIAGIGAGDINLAQTGMPTFMLILASMFAYLTYMRTGRRRYLAIKRLALRPL